MELLLFGKFPLPVTLLCSVEDAVIAGIVSDIPLAIPELVKDLKFWSHT